MIYNIMNLMGINFYFQLVAQGAIVIMAVVQIHSGSRPPAHLECGHLPLKTLSHIALVARRATGLNVEVF